MRENRPRRVGPNLRAVECDRKLLDAREFEGADRDRIALKNEEPAESCAQQLSQLVGRVGKGLGEKGKHRPKVHRAWPGVHLADKIACGTALLSYCARSVFMAKTSWINRNDRKRATAKKYAALRAELKANKDYAALSQLPRDASPTRVVNRCQVSGRRRAFIRRFKVSRLVFRELASAGLIPGVTKSSW